MDATHPTWTGTHIFEGSTCAQYVLPDEHIPHFGVMQSHVAHLLTDSRRQRIEAIAKSRSRRVLCVFENTQHSHNISAVLRSVEALGFMDTLFVYPPVERRSKVHDSVERGAASWLAVRRTQSIPSTMQALKRAGYLVALISLPSFETTGGGYRQDLNSFSVRDMRQPAFLDFVGGRRVALIFGSELKGIHRDWLVGADAYFHIPMQGFVESLNVSVCAGVVLQTLKEVLCPEMFEKAESGFISEENALIREYYYANATDSIRQILKKNAPLDLPYFDFVKRAAFFNCFDLSGSPC